jgi:hypothetical protein
VEPKLKRDQITTLDDKTLIALVSEVLDIARGNMEDIGFVPMPQDKGPPRDMIA